MIPESNITEELDFLDKKRTKISGLQLSVGDYMVTSKFIVSSLWSFDSDIILGLPWIKTLGTFILNAEKKFLTFSYKRKRITFQDITMKSEIEPPTFEEFQDISKLISQGNPKSEQKKQKEVENFVTSKDEEITCLKNHSQDLIAQIKKLKREKRSQEESQEEFHQKEVDLQNDFNKKLLQKNEENSHLKILNQGLTEQIKKLKNEKLKKSLELLSINKSQESQTIKVSTCVPQTSLIPYRHPNHISR